MLNGMQEKLKLQRVIRFLDLGCGYGYSTLAFALMVDKVIKADQQMSFLGIDLHHDFIEKCTTLTILEKIIKNQASLIQQTLDLRHRQRLFRIKDKKNDLDKSLDQDYFNTYMRQQKIELFIEQLQHLEQQFKDLKQKNFGSSEIKLTEVLKVPEIAQVLVQIRDRKTKVQKLELAMKDSLEGMNKENKED
ncbi:UNKNOWN [Stylonychia lemnae]|uniref:Methyltransferase domain-containing protein n=1 Tax=Stylonychia lemnae TaxID=5949 RepID=A0A078B461_STYLE|nr:UNKNOWN [Stylonychia lemnae]|eukprot:CDW89036.1 UNKNOWN [Stylonychia lemnae]